MTAISEPIQAYYKLVFPQSEYYLQTLSVTIGRRPVAPPPQTAKPEPSDDNNLIKSDGGVETSLAQEGTAGSSVPKESSNGGGQSLKLGGDPSESGMPARPQSSHSNHPVVDVDLGPLKSVSRLHARIDYDERLGKFVLSVLGRNGAWVDGDWVGCGGRVALGADTKIQIASRTFSFVLPPQSAPAPTVTPGTTPDISAQADATLNTPSACHSRSQSRSASPAVHPSPSTFRQPSSTKTVIKPAVDRAVSISGADSDEDLLVSIEDLAPEDLHQLESAGPKVKGDRAVGDKPGRLEKSSSKSKARLPKPAWGPSPARPLLAPKPGPSAAKPDRSTKGPPNSAKSLKPAKPSQIKPSQTKPDPPRPPPEKMPPKPPYTYALLCYRAIHAYGGHASLSEIVNWIREEFEWYRWNDECGWESSVRHNLSSNPAFIKDRRENLPQVTDIFNGKPRKTKGFFWSVDPKSEESFQEKEREIKEMGNRVKSLSGKGKGKEREDSTTTAPVPGMSAPQMSFPHPGAKTLTYVTRGPYQIGPTSHPIHHAMQLPIPVPSLGPPSTLSASSQMQVLTSPPLPLSVSQNPPSSASTAPSTGGPQSATPAVGNQPSASMSDVCLPIVIGSPPSTTAMSDSSTVVLPFTDGPPITLHSGKLFLNPTIFSGLTSEQLAELQTLKAAKALEILQGYIKSFLKEQMVRKQGRGRVKAKGGKTTEAGDHATISTTSPSAPPTLTPPAPPVSEGSPVLSSQLPPPLETTESGRTANSAATVPMSFVVKDNPSPTSTPISMSSPAVCPPAPPPFNHRSMMPPPFAYYPHLPTFSHVSPYHAAWYPHMAPQFPPYPQLQGMAHPQLNGTVQAPITQQSSLAHPRPVDDNIEARSVKRQKLEETAPSSLGVL